MKIKVFIKPLNEQTVFINSKQSFHDLYISLGGLGYPKMVQIGGALGPLIKGKTLHNIIYAHKKDFLEPFLTFFDDFCPIDYMRFLTRFVLRNLNIVNDQLIEIYKIISNTTNNKASIKDLSLLKDLLQKSPDTFGEKLLYLRLKSLLDWYEEDFIDHLQGHCKYNVCRGLFEAQCINTCPAHIHIPGFVALMKQKRYQEAYRLMRKENPFNSICGYICARPCESACRRKEITDTLGVRALQRFISSQGLKEPLEELCLEENGKSIGIVGGGPSGLTAAYYLKRTGYDITVYEKEDRLGGMLAFGVPEYRLPLTAIDEEIQTIVDLGIDIQLSTSIGSDITIETIQGKHDGLIISTGRPLGKKIDLNHPNVLTAIDFLKSIRQSNTFKPMKNTLVIGGGDVAMDCSRTAIRLGGQVTLMSLESYDLMPASSEEKIQCQEEGVKLVTGYGINYISGESIHLSKCLEVFDCENKFNPTMLASDQVLEDIDTIILAIGQNNDLSFLSENGGTSNEKPVYFCGDVTDPTNVIDAIAKGKKAALNLHHNFGGHELFTGETVEVPEDVLSILSFDYDHKNVRTIPQKDRFLNFEPVNQNYTFEEAFYEANRCMRCDQNSKAPLLLGRKNI